MRKIPAKKFDETQDKFYTLETTVSATECTGLAPAAIENEAQAEAYGELYAIHNPVAEHTDEKFS